ncbi:MAG TPA: LexA family transcriptional regulator [Alphaproteobacteria bacterium]|nr:LexA family transcriptional regulator [Alphaproteobacteria bacterium]
MQNTDTKAIGIALLEVDRYILAARLKLARQRIYPSATAASNALAAGGNASAKSLRSYLSYESGDRVPKYHDLVQFARLLDVPIEFFVYGGHPDIDDHDVEIQATVTRRRHEQRRRDVPEARTPINADKSKTSPAPVNQAQRSVELNSIHNAGVRFIPVLSASEIRKNNTGRGGPMSGQTLPVPQSLGAGEHSYSYQVPEHDLSMASKDGASFGPGTFLVADRDAPILPGKFVLAVLDGIDEPLFRIYRAARPYAAGVAFSLHALNPAYEPIVVADPAMLLHIHRVIYTAISV